MLNFRRPTREKSYLRGSKNMPLNSAVAVSSVGGSPGRILRYISISASCGVLIVSRLSVWLSTEPRSSRSANKTRISAIFNSSTELSAAGVSSLLASSNISPVAVSTMSAALEAPSRSLAEISISAILAFSSLSRTSRVIRRLAARITSSVRGCAMVFEIFCPRRPGETCQ